MQDLSECVSNADTIVNSHPGADFDLIGDLHEEQIIEIACGDSLKSLHVFCKKSAFDVRPEDCPGVGRTH